MSNAASRSPTAAARKALAARFRLPYSDEMQDWEWEVADAERFGEFVDAYRLAELTDDERFSLVELLVQCAEDLKLPSNYEAAWSAIEPLLLSSPNLHRSTVAYWARLNEVEPQALFQVSENMRRVWSVISA